MRARAVRGQNLVEVIVIVALVALALTWVVTEFPKGITKHFKGVQSVVCSPL